ncbi:MAG: SRPBCC family protein, partial [Candidatus Hydrothermarchaeaceae archaeon]
SIEINASLGDVFALVSDLSRYPDFIPGVTAVERIDDVKSKWKAEAFGVPLYWASEFVTWVENEEISWRSYDGIKNEGTWRLEEVDGGGCKLTFIMEYELPKSLGLIGTFLDQNLMVGELEKRVGQGLQKVKTLAEGK